MDPVGNRASTLDGILSRRNARSVLGLVAVTLASLLVAAPAAAYTPDPEFSRVRCLYTMLSPDEMVLRRFRVAPPRLDDSRPGTTYGWRFVVHRDGVRTYRSPVQKATADANGEFAFSPMKVDVRVPGWPSSDSWRAHHYSVTIKLKHYGADGNVQWTRSFRIYTYRVWIDGEFAYKDSGCSGRVRGFDEGADAASRQ